MWSYGVRTVRLSNKKKRVMAYESYVFGKWKMRRWDWLAKGLVSADRPNSEISRDSISWMNKKMGQERVGWENVM